jgi:hypothetical protein
MGQLGHVLVPRILGVAQPTVGLDLMVEGMAGQTTVFVHTQGRALVAQVTPDTHGEMGIV